MDTDDATAGTAEMAGEHSEMTGTTVLVADLGATNARFALVTGAEIHGVSVLSCADFTDIGLAVDAYRAATPGAANADRAAFAIASPVVGGRVEMTNWSWSFSIAELRDRLGLARLEVMNDFVAVAHAIPALTEADRIAVGGGQPDEKGIVGIIGPGTGLGVSTLTPSPAGWVALPGEGGHVTMAAVNDREAAVLSWLRRRFEHVSAERVLSGMGLANLYEAIAAVDGQPDIRELEPQEVSEAARGGRDAVAVEAVEMFCAMLGTVAGNLALTVGAHGGVYIAGGIVPKLGTMFLESPFRQRFEAKGRLSDYLSGIPTDVVTHAFPAFLGLREAVTEG